MLQYETLQDILREAMNLLRQAENELDFDSELSARITDWLDANG